MQCLHHNFFVSLPFFKVVLMCCPHSIERRNNHGQVGYCVPKLCKVVRHLGKKCFYFFYILVCLWYIQHLENNLCPWGRDYSHNLTCVLNIGQTIGILLVNKGTSGLTSNTLLIPLQDLFVVFTLYRFKKTMRGKFKWCPMEFELVSWAQLSLYAIHWIGGPYCFHWQ